MNSYHVDKEKKKVINEDQMNKENDEKFLLLYENNEFN